MYAPKPVHRLLLPALLVSVTGNVWLLWQIHRTPPSVMDASLPALATAQQNKPRPPRIASDSDHASLLQRAIARNEEHETMRVLVEEWAARSPEASLQWIQAHTEGTLSLELTIAGIQAWARVSPRAAADWAYHMPLGDGREKAIAGLVETWAAADAPTAIAWLESLHGCAQPIAKESWLQAADRAASVWAGHDPAAAAVWSHRFQETYPESRAFTRAMTVWGAADPAAGRAYFESLPAHTEIAVQAAAALGEGMARVSSIQALDWALSLPADDTGWQARNAVFTQWAETSPSQAAEAVSAVAQPEERAQHTGTILTLWATTNVDAAEAWARSLPQGPDYDRAMNSLADSYVARHPAKALEIALDIQSPTLRAESASGVLAWWRDTDQAAAEAWLAGANLSEELRSVLSPTEEEDGNE